MLTPPSTGKVQSFNPRGQTFRQRLDAFIGDVRTYGLFVGQDSGRTAEWEQRLHICHMFLYNKYQSTTPANVDSGKRTISWSHLSDPKVVWVTVKETDILRTAKDMAPARGDGGWKAGSEPDQA